MESGEFEANDDDDEPVIDCDCDNGSERPVYSPSCLLTSI